MEEMLADCCIRFMQLITDLKDAGTINHEEYEEMAKMKTEFLSRVGILAKK